MAAGGGAEAGAAAGAGGGAAGVWGGVRGRSAGCGGARAGPGGAGGSAGLRRAGGRAPVGRRRGGASGSRLGSGRAAVRSSPAAVLCTVGAPGSGITPVQSGVRLSQPLNALLWLLSSAALMGSRVPEARAQLKGHNARTRFHYPF